MGARPMTLDDIVVLEAAIDRACAEMDRLRTQRDCLLAALQGMTERYTALVNCGDCGNWDPESEAVVIAARAVIAAVEGAR